MGAERYVLGDGNGVKRAIRSPVVRLRTAVSGQIFMRWMCRSVFAGVTVLHF